MAVNRTGFFSKLKGLRPFTARVSNGRRYETLATRWLKHQGLKILRRNFRVLGIEIDCLAIDRQQRIWLVEVRGRRDASWRAVETMTPTKMRRLQRAAECLCNQMGQTVHLVLVEVVGDPDQKNALIYRFVRLD